VPLLASASAVATNLLVILLLHSRLGFRAVALGTALGALVNAAILLVTFDRSVGLGGKGMTAPLAKMVGAAALMGPVAWGIGVAIERAVGTRGLAAQGLTGLVPVVGGAVVYLAAALALRIPEAATLLDILRRRGRSG
jgi:peptidoglycan biosynthesis protein MviN/MurJ (putative lipid II flippase)